MEALRGHGTLTGIGAFRAREVEALRDLGTGASLLGLGPGALLGLGLGAFSLPPLLSLTWPLLIPVTYISYQHGYRYIWGAHGLIEGDTFLYEFTLTILDS